MKRLYTYALVNSLYNENKDYIDCFTPFVVAVCGKEMISIKAIQEKINERYGILIPQHTLQTITKRARRKDYLEGDNKQCRISSEGEKLNVTISSEKETEREARELIESFVQFCKDNRNKIVQFQKAEKCAYSYIHDRLESLRYLLKDNKALSSDTENECKNTLSKDFLAFVEKIESSNNRLFKILSNIVYGTIISLAIGGIDIPEIEQKFQPTILFLDTNVIFDLLGFQGDDAMRVTKEFINITKQNKSFSLYVSDLTVDEICRVLEVYPIESNRYLSEIEVDSIYYHLKKKGWNRARVAQFITNIDKKLKEYNIRIYDTRNIKYTGMDLEGDRELLNNYKSSQGLKGQEHDLKTIWTIKILRKEPCRRIQTAKFFFLSQDVKLARFNYKEQGHQDSQTIPEVLIEGTLTNLLWLREPKKIPLSSLIAFHKEHAVISKNVWEMFQDIMSEAQTKDPEILEDATILLCYRRLQRTLTEIEDDSPRDEIVSAIKKHADDLRRENDAKYSASLAKQEEVHRKQLMELAKVAEEEKKAIANTARNIELNKIRRFIQDLRRNSYIAADNYIKWGCRFLCICEILTLIFLLYSRVIQTYWSHIEPVAWAIGISLPTVLVLCKLDVHHVWSKFKEWIRSNIYEKRIKKANIPELLKALGVEDSEIRKHKGGQVGDDIKEENVTSDDESTSDSDEYVLSSSDKNILNEEKLG